MADVQPQPQQMQPDTLNLLVSEAAGETLVCIQDLTVRAFGEDRVRAFLKQRNGERFDPELAECIEAIHVLVADSWHEKGVSEAVGPYLK